jgi:hypothetical protein
MARHSPTIKDVWNAVPLLGRVALVAAAGLLVVATVVRLHGTGAAAASSGPSMASAPTPAPTRSTPSRASAAYSDGYQMGADLLQIGYTPVPAGMGTTAIQSCEQGVGGNVDVQRSLTQDLDQKESWYRGCADALMHPGQTPG